MLRALTAVLTPPDPRGFEDINGLHAVGQAEYIATDISDYTSLTSDGAPY